MSNKKPVYWAGRVNDKDDFGRPIVNEFYDGQTKRGPWAIMTKASWDIHGYPERPLGVGNGQRYEKQPDGRFMKVEG